MTAHLQQVMNTEESAETPSGISKNSGARERISSLMEMDYEEADENPAEPEVESKKEHSLNSKADPDKKEETETKKEREPEKEKKEDSKKEKDKEQEKPTKKKYSYKSDGEDIEEELSDEEVNSRLSGSRAIQKRFTDLDVKNKEYLKNKQLLDDDVKYIQSEMKTVRDGFSSVIEEFKTKGMSKNNPIEPVYNLLDKMGLDISEFEKALFFHMLPEAGRYLDMDDIGRNAYDLERENKWLKKNQNAAKEREAKLQEERERLHKENSLKRQAGVSEEQFSELKEELETRFGLKDLKTEQVVEWAKAKPFYDRATKISELVPGTDANKVARILLEFPETTDEWMLEQLGHKKVQEKAVEDKLKDKLPPKVSKHQDDDDDTNEMFLNFRRR